MSEAHHKALQPDAIVPGRSDANGAVPRKMGRTRSFSGWWLGLIVVVELLVLFALAELVAAWFLPPGHHYRYPQMLIEPNARRTYYHRPNQQAFTIDKPFVTNALGFRDEREVPAEKGAEFRILALGDSVTVGLGVAAEETYARQLEALLSRSIAPLRVINAAVTCYSTWQEVDVLKETAPAVRPDVVTLAFYWNDLYPKPEVIAPIADVHTVVAQDAAQQYMRLFKSSRALSFVRERWASLSNSLWPTFDWAHRNVIYKGDSTPYLEQAYEDVRASLEEFAALGREGFVPVLLLLPMPLQVQQAEEPARHMQERIEAIAARAGLRVLDLLPALRRAYAQHRDLYIAWDYEHFTPRGHRVVAEALQRYLVDQRLLPSVQKAQELASAR
jgi:lysophospholipase L1-like esterase